MNLFVESRKALRWALKVLGAFWRVRPWTTLAVILAKVTNRFCSMLAFFLPLKVVLLAGSDGVPRYFQFFIDPSDKEFWILLLSLGAVGLYLLTLLLDALIKSLSESGGAEVLQGANEIAVASRHREEVKGYFSRFSGIAANLLVVALGYTALGAINPMLVTVLLALVVLQYIFTAVVVRYGNSLNPGRLSRMVKFRLHSYLDILSSINFLAGFFVLLIPFLLYGVGNLLVAILSILLMRQTSGAFKGVATATTDLWKKRLEVDPMVFKHRQQMRKEQAVSINLRQAFAKEVREQVVEDYIEHQSGIGEKRLESLWEDSTVKGIYTFHLVRGGQHWLQRVFPKRQLHLLENEQFLFEKLSRGALCAPAEVARFAVGPFECHVVEYGEGGGVSQVQWASFLPSLLQHYWSIGVPESLLGAYISSRQTLEGRLTSEFLRRIEIALDTSQDIKVYEDLIRKLPKVKQTISMVPLYIYNPELVRNNVVNNSLGNPLVISWGRWSVEHIGVSVPKSISRDQLEGILAKVIKERKIPSGSLTLDHVDLVSFARELEKEVAQGNYKAALRLAESIVENPLLEERVLV